MFPGTDQNASSPGEPNHGDTESRSVSFVFSVFPCLCGSILKFGVNHVCHYDPVLKGSCLGNSMPDLGRDVEPGRFLHMFLDLAKLRRADQ